MILVCGATGQLGGRIARRLVARGASVRIATRGAQPAASLRDLAKDAAEVDFRRHESLTPAVRGAETVVSGASALAGLLTGIEGKDALRAVDEQGHLALIEAAERAGVRRFVFISVAGAERMRHVPLVRAKLRVEERLRHSPLESVIVRPESFQETWLTPAAQLDWDAGRLVVFGRGEARMPYVAVDDVADLVATVAVADRPPAELSFGGA